MINKTRCLSCKAEYTKERFLFDFCPVCKGKKLKSINQGVSE